MINAQENRNHACNFQQLLKIKRASKKMTVAEVVRRTKYSNYYLLERGQRTLPRPQHLKSICDVLCITQEEIDTAMKNDNLQRTKLQKEAIAPDINSLTAILDNYRDKVRGLDEQDALSKMIKDKASANIGEAIRLLNEIRIIDKLIYKA